MKERRRYPRMDVSVKVKYHKLEGAGAKKEAMSKNISAEGFCFETEQEIKPGTTLQLELLTRDDEQPIRVRGSVVWSEKIKNKKSYYTGVRILDVGKVDESRFLTLYCNRLAERLDRHLHL